MKLDRLKGPALAATAVLLISGAGIAFADSPAPASPAARAEVPDANEAPEADEPAGPDADALEEGDQTGPDATDAAGSASGSATGSVVSQSAAKVSLLTLAQAPVTVEPAPAATDPATDPTGEVAEPAGEALEAADGTEAAGVEEPGDENLPGGGHADDPNDPNADHQFEGVE